MKKTITTLLFALVTVLGFAQMQTKTLVNNQIGPLSCKYLQISGSELDGDFIYISYQDYKYQYINSPESILFSMADTTTIRKFVADLKDAISKLNTGSI